jgi:hypothetical protein
MVTVNYWASDAESFQVSVQLGSEKSPEPMVASNETVSLPWLRDNDVLSIFVSALPAWPAQHLQLYNASVTACWTEDDGYPWWVWLLLGIFMPLVFGGIVVGCSRNRVRPCYQPLGTI